MAGTPRTTGNLIANMDSQLADNNAGMITAANVRQNMEDIVASINIIVASGDTNVAFPFTQDVRAQIQGSGGAATGGSFIAESGLLFPNAPVGATQRQVQPFLGVNNLDHNSLANLTAGDVHTQYYPIAGTRPLTGNMPTAAAWIGPSGNANEGFQFTRTATGIQIKTSGTLLFGDNTHIRTAKGVARAWLNFDASGVVNGTGNMPVVRSSYNIYKLERLSVGTFRITFNSGVFSDNNYVAIGMSNSTTGSGSPQDFDHNQVACVIRTGDDGNSLRTCSYVIRNDEDQYTDGKINDFVAYGVPAGSSYDATPIVVGF